MTRTSSDDAAFDAWLLGRGEEWLVTLLSVRPDLAVPPPLNGRVLCERVRLRASVQRAMDEADYFTLSVVEAFVVAGAARERVPATAAAEVLRAAGLEFAEAEVSERVMWLRERALLWGDDPEGAGGGAGQPVRLLASVAECVPWRAGRLGSLRDVASVGAVPDLVAGADEAQRSILETLAHGSPVGSTRDAEPGADPERPVPRLIEAGLLVRVDERTVELPHHVGQWLRGDAMVDPHSVAEPAGGAGRAPGQKQVDGAAAGEVADLLRECDALVTALGDAPLQGLRAGGVGVRELRRLAKQSGVAEERSALLLEVLVEAGLVGSQPATSGLVLEWAPTDASDAWGRADMAHRWSVLARAWWLMPRRPWLVGARDRDGKPVVVLSDEVGQVSAPADRRVIVEAVAAGRGADALAVQRWLLWRWPRLSRRFGGVVVRSVLAEARQLGVVASGVLSGLGVSAPGQVLLEEGDLTALARAVDGILPEPLDHVLVQADLTVVAPGPLLPELQQQVALVADVESAGAATVFRVTERSVLRALDAGWSAAQVHQLFERRSRTPVPQALSYLVDDMARRHGRLRVGVGSAFVRCEDPALLSEILASSVADVLGLRALAPTVAVSQAPLTEVLERLRAAGFSPAGEGVDGAIVDMRPRGTRVPPHRMPRRAAAGILHAPPREQLEQVVRNVRAAAAEPGRVGASMSETLAMLQLALASRSRVTIGYVDAQGVAGVRTVVPVSVAGGQLEAVDASAGVARRFPMHRISAVTVHDA
ncbi:helicase-associated domain-containing protein [Lolliginicoccus suaedae]|uniref:helicase-associated domain-containing protein n=1 Tax=Lolliginicoccus suaedae TaxID=2605429 RepID=UPI0011ED439E|nr:helicase-associated domain-containing protein [Lolliginicoccus suaedae]